MTNHESTVLDVVIAGELTMWLGNHSQI